MQANIRVVLNAKTSYIAQASLEGDNIVIRVKLATPPEKGKANKRLIELLAKELKVPKSSVSIIKGEKSREKKVEIIDLTPKIALEALARYM